MEQIGPHQIRLELLKLAYNILYENQQAEFIKKQLDEGTKANEVLAVVNSKIEIDEVITQAQKLNNFISTKK